MEQQIRIVQPGPLGALKDEHGNTILPPRGWIFLPAGDAGVTRKVTAKGKYWRVQERRGNKVFTKGVWAPAENIENAKSEAEQQRSAPEYQKKMEQSKMRRDQKQQLYEEDFLLAVKSYLNFHPSNAHIEDELARYVTIHATPVGSGTVARTSMIAIEERAAKAVIAWMRHHTTRYDNMKIARIKGERRMVRHNLAVSSLELLQRYRETPQENPDCKLQKALETIRSTKLP